jgi:hypothetical protein
MMQAQYRNIGGTESLWVNHTVRTSSTGPVGIQWAQINVTGGTVSGTPAQQQIYGKPRQRRAASVDGSLAVDKDGNMAHGYSVSSSSVNPDIRYAGRLATDPLNTLPQGETTMLPRITRGSQSGSCGGTCTRWGDYSAMSVAPDGCTSGTRTCTTPQRGSTGTPGSARSSSRAVRRPPRIRRLRSTKPRRRIREWRFRSPSKARTRTRASWPFPSSAGRRAELSARSPTTPARRGRRTRTAPRSPITYKVNDGTSDSNVASVSITVNATATSYHQAVLADSPAAYWRLGES